MQQKIDELINDNKNLSREFQRLRSSVEDIDKTVAENAEKLGAIEQEVQNVEDIQENIQEDIHDLETKGIFTLSNFEYNNSSLKYTFILVLAPFWLIFPFSGVSGPGYDENGKVCQDKKTWCKLADCSLENVLKNCPKTCNQC